MSAPSSRAPRNRLIRLRNLRQAQAQEAQQADPSQTLSPGFDGRWTRRQWAQASLMATMVALVGAIVPGFASVLEPVDDGARVQTQTMSLKLPPLSVIRRQGNPGDSWQSVTVKRGASLRHMFATLGIGEDDLDRVLAHPGVKEAIGYVTPDVELSVDLPVGGKLRAVRYLRKDGQRVQLNLVDDSIRETVIKRDVDVRTVVLSGKVGRSLFRSARKQGLTSVHLDQLTDEMFKYDIDFDSDLDEDDRFSVVVDQTWVDGQLEKTGPVLAAAFTVDGKLHTAFRHNRNGKPEYFTSDGRPLKKNFIRMPIPYARLSSSFGARRHPVLGNMRMHKGVDYAASTGTPIQAAGDARVQFVGWQGGYGKTVVLDHGRGTTTLYGHMSRFGNIRQGQRVAQGTVIGYVGSTGMSTGPHLHYEFRINGVHRNPLSVTLPPPEPLRGAELASFRAETQRAMTKIRTVENIVFPAGMEPIQVAAADKPGAAKKKNAKG
ncbi:MAG: M23 family metallopeptidase [Lysobacter sp.]|nr:M23 family metallopeptidase [Lysobacter sp.]